MVINFVSERVLDLGAVPSDSTNYNLLPRSPTGSQAEAGSGLAWSPDQDSQKVIIGGVETASTDVNINQILPEVDNSSLKKNQKQ